MAEIEINNIKDLQEQLDKAVAETKNKPTDEEIKIAGEEFEKAAKNFPGKMWEIGVEEQSRGFVEYLQYFVDNRIFWTKNGWMGVVKLKEELQAAANLLNGKEPLKLGYQAVEFTYYSLMNPGGIGLESAKNFEAEGEQYLPLMEAVSLALQKAREELKEIQFLQDKYAAMQQGFYYEREIEIESPPESPIEQSLESPIKSNEELPNPK